jgi:hypothetical protein
MLGCWLFAVNPLQGNYVVALVFLVIGAIPLYALSLLYGAVVLQLKETNALIRIAQSLFSLAMGIYYPVTVLPEAEQPDGRRSPRCITTAALHPDAPCAVADHLER